MPCKNQPEIDIFKTFKNRLFQFLFFEKETNPVSMMKYLESQIAMKKLLPSVQKNLFAGYSADICWKLLYNILPVWISVWVSKVPNSQLRKRVC
jgi:hypothetical protein